MIDLKSKPTPTNEVKILCDTEQFMKTFRGIEPKEVQRLVGAIVVGMLLSGKPHSPHEKRTMTQAGLFISAREV